MNAPGRAYPLTVDIGDAESRVRWSVFVRLPLGLPVVLFSLLLNIGATFAVWAALLVSGRVPSWLFDYQVHVGRWQTRAMAYVLMLTDDYPVFEGDHPVVYELDEPTVVLRRKVVVWKFITAIPQFIVLFVLTVVLVPVSVVAWLALVLTGRHPRPLRAYAAGVVSWYARLAVYLQSLTDEYPAYSLRRGAGRSGRRAYVISAGIGLGPSCAVAALAIYIVGFTGTHVSREISYEALRDGSASAATVESGVMRLLSVTDPVDAQLGLFRPDVDARYVAFTMSISNHRGAGETVPVAASSFRLEDADGAFHDPVLVGVDGVPGHGVIAAGRVGEALLVFEVPGDEPPERLIWDVLDYISVPRRGETIEWAFT